MSRRVAVFNARLALASTYHLNHALSAVETHSAMARRPAFGVLHATVRSAITQLVFAHTAQVGMASHKMALALNAMDQHGAMEPRSVFPAAKGVEGVSVIRVTQ